MSGHTQTLSNALMEALSPAVTTCEGSGNRYGTIALANRTGKFGAFLILLFAVPMVLEMKSLLVLWLGRIPDFVVPICVLALASAIVEKFTMGYQMAISATGKIALWQLTGGVLNILIFPATWLFAASGVGPISASIAFLLCPCCTFCTNLFFAKRILGADIKMYLLRVVLPVVAVVALSAGAGLTSLFMFAPEWWRVLITTFFCLVVMLPAAWFWVLSADERVFVRGKLRFHVK